ncbi:FKBP-type peptidyl-prolyl cis-trans isomerase [Amycolatopsis aidingensis]|uniref:FKBP-type peptidyl-prolyl cis-trans isomerase n=1 Tax=Amycolatopsis aidingensis TaxID=2842453 RepID=UPI0022B725F4|nr:FKBP-type peptidyl-prolyl cis-trans isomerase [Amycolatopsis aidingensis]
MALEKPEIDRPEGIAPGELEVEELVEGEGPEALPGQDIEVHYVGVTFSSGEEFDSSWSRGEPLAFQLGVGQVIAGWDRGIAGMRVGGRRKLIIPSHLAYGEEGAGDAIGPDESLVFVVDLVSVS